MAVRCILPAQHPHLGASVLSVHATVGVEMGLPSPAPHSWVGTTAHAQMRSHILFTWTHLLLGLCGSLWSVFAPALRSPGIILDSNQILATSVLAKASGELSPGLVTQNSINRTCRHSLVAHFHGALFSQQQTIGTGRRLRMRQTFTRHPCTDLLAHKGHVVACGLLAGSGVLGGTRF